MFTTKVNFKLKVGSVIKVKKQSRIFDEGVYVVYNITASLSSPDMVQTKDDVTEYFFENIDTCYRDYLANEKDLTDDLVEVLDSKVDLYKVKYLDLDTGDELEDKVYTLHGTDVSKEYFSKRIEPSYNYSQDVSGIVPHDIEVKSWELVASNI